jgi:hypothetical protein
VGTQVLCLGVKWKISGVELVAPEWGEIAKIGPSGIRVGPAEDSCLAELPSHCASRRGDTASCDSCDGNPLETQKAPEISGCLLNGRNRAACEMAWRRRGD